MPGEPTWWDEAFDAWWWLERFGKTPAEVDAMPAHVVARIPHIAEMVDAHREEQTKEAGGGVPG